MDMPHDRDEAFEDYRSGKMLRDKDEAEDAFNAGWHAALDAVQRQYDELPTLETMNE